MDNILFLDIDGPICCERIYRAYNQHKTRNIIRSWDPVAVRLISNIAEEFNLITVISSTWRHNNDVPNILLSHGFNGNFHEDDKTPFKFSSNRVQEIGLWLGDHPEVENYLIIDDLESGWSLKGSTKEPNTVFADIENGFSYQNYLRAIEICKSFKTQ